MSLDSRKQSQKLRTRVHSAKSLLALHKSSTEPVKISPEDGDALVQRVLVTLSSAQAFRAASLAVFREFSINVAQAGEAPENELPLEHLPCILAHWRIPEEHLPLFWAMIRQELKSGNSSVLPQSISLDTFQGALIRLLRRIRDRYCGSVSRDRSVRLQTAKFEDEYTRTELCGKGSFGECHWVTHQVTKQTRVAKSILKEGTCLPNEEIVWELKALKDLDHPHVMRIFEWFESEDSFILILEGAHGGDLRQLLKHEKRKGKLGISESIVRSLLEQSFAALGYIHSQRIIHRDIKPANMLLVKADVNPLHVLLADFGVSMFFEEEGRNPTDTRGTLTYMGPEVFNGEVSPRSDIWSMGVVMYELLTGQLPYKGDNPLAIYAAVSLTNRSYDVEPLHAASVSDAACKFISKLLIKEESSRPSAQEILNEDWLKEKKPKADSATSSEALRKSVMSMKSFRKKSTFSRSILNCVAGQLDASSLENLTQVFHALDADHSGRLSLQELLDGLTQFGLRKELIEEVADALDLKHDHEVDYNEFVAGCLETHTEILDGALYHVFRVFDVNNDGQIDVDELRAMLSGEGASAHLLPDGKTVENVLQEMDTSKNGSISYQEFKAYLKKENPNLSITGSPDHFQGDFAQEWKGFPICEPSSPSMIDPAVVELLRGLLVDLGRDEKEVPQYVALLERHWLQTVADLRRLHSEDWARLQLPLKLERALRDHLDSIQQSSSEQSPWSLSSWFGFCRCR